jgi:hypothetical protein
MIFYKGKAGKDFVFLCVFILALVFIIQLRLKAVQKLAIPPETVEKGID